MMFWEQILSRDLKTARFQLRALNRETSSSLGRHLDFSLVGLNHKTTLLQEENFKFQKLAKSVEAIRYSIVIVSCEDPQAAEVCPNKFFLFWKIAKYTS